MDGELSSPLVQAIHAHQADRPWLVVPTPTPHDGAPQVISYGMLGDAAARIASGLVAAGANPGARVAVIADNSSATCQLIIGILTAGMAVVPVAPKGTRERHDDWRLRINRIQSDCNPTLLVGSARMLAEAAFPPGLTVRSFESFCDDDHPVPIMAGSADGLALVQYTSGTLNRPRGVALSSRNIVSNVRAIGQAIEVSEADVTLCWIPLFHDMGMIGTLLFASYWGLPTVLMTPRSFLTHPESWLWNIARHRVTCCAAPNSAYQLCATRIPDSKLSGLDLSSWRVACNGSELVHHQTLVAFSKKFGPYGFRPEAMCPLYGLAENTVAATFPSTRRSPRIDWVDRRQLEREGLAVPSVRDDLASRPVVSVGPIIKDHRIRVVGADSGCDLPERTVGEVLVQGPSVCRGYFSAAEPSCATGHERWLSTGDCGYLADGELYLTGRAKEIIKRAGDSYDAAYLASALSTVEGIRHGAVAVFGLANEATGTEDIVALAETKVSSPADRDALVSALHVFARDTLRVRLDTVALVRPGRIPRTTSGKVQHARAREVYVEELCTRTSCAATGRRGALASEVPHGMEESP